MSIPSTLPLVGRTDELARLESLLALAEGEPRLRFVRGEGGVGKSRLVAELADRAEQGSWRVLRGRAYSVESGVPYALFADTWLAPLKAMEPSALTVLSRGGEADLRQLFPALGSAATDPGPAAAGLPEEFRTRIMWTFAEFVRHYAARKPLVCVMEDLQWADESSLELLHFLTRHLRDEPVAFLCTYNDQERDRRRRLVQIERSLEDIGVGGVMRLSPLSREHVGELVSRTFGIDAEVVRDFSGYLYGWTRGNPFFLEEVLKAMVASRRLRAENGTWVGWGAKEFGMSPSIRDAVLNRVLDLPDETRTVLELATVVGNRISFGVLEAVAEGDASAVVSAIEALCAASLLDERTEGGEIFYDFRHPLVRQTLYEEFSLQRAKLLHARVAEAIEAYYGEEAEAHADELAYHFARADGKQQQGKAIRYLLSAGRSALARRADQEAVAYLEAALDRIPSDAASEPTLLALLPLLARAHTHVGDVEAATRLWERALAELPEGDPQRLRVRQALGLTNVWAGRHAQAQGHFEAGLDEAERAGDHRWTVRILVAKAHALHEVGDGTGALEVLAVALPLAEEIGDPAVLARVHRALGLLYVWVGPPDQAIHHSERALELADEVGDVSVGFWARWGLAVLYGMRGDIPRMMRGVAEINEVADQTRSPVLRLWTTDMLVEHAYATGQWDAGIARGEKGIALARSLHQRTLLPRLLVWTSQFHAARGDLARAEALVHEAVEISGIESTENPMDVHRVVPTYIGLAHYLVHLGDYDDAIDAARKGLAIADGTGYTLWAMHRLLPILAEACLWAGRIDEAEEVGRRMREHAERIDHRIGRAWADACDSLVRWKRGDPGGAVEQMLGAADELECIPMLWPATRLRRQVAGRLDEIGRREDALRQLRKVHAVCVSVGAGLELEKTRGMFREMGVSPPSAPSRDGPLGLTEAELRVARLVAGGRSNRAVARELLCADGTVRTHLQNIYAKHGIGGPGARHRLSNLIREAGLLE